MASGPNAISRARRREFGAAVPRGLLWLLVGLLGAILVIRFLIPPKPPESQPASREAAERSASRDAAASRAAADSGASITAAIPKTPAENLEVRNDKLAVRASSRGARLLSVRLLGFALQVGVPPAVKNDPERALELVYHSRAGVSALSVFLPIGPYDDKEHPLHGIVGMLETADWSSEKLAPEGDKGEGIRWRLTAGPLVFTKTFRLPRTGYVGELEIEVAARDSALEESRDASSALQLLFVPGGWVYSDHDQFFASPYAAAGHGKPGSPDTVEVRPANGLVKGTDPTMPSFADWLQRPEGDRFHFLGDANKYFIAAALPATGPAEDSIIATKLLAIPSKDDKDRPEPRIASAALLKTRLPKLGAPIRLQFQTFFGPKSDAEMRALPSLEGLVKHDRTSFLTFAWLTDAFTAGLKLFAGFTGNWGVAIILLTLCLRAALFPLTRRSQAAMASMAAKQAVIKPQLDELTKKYKDNPKKLNEERFRLYRENKVPLAPPLMGCLPLFLNIPIFVGFFSAIRPLYELRQEPFFLWVTDLSRPDELIDFHGSFRIPILGSLMGDIRGLNILPLIMMAMWVVNQIVMQKNMPRPSDPQQAQVQKFTMVLSTIMGLFLYNYAAALSLYSITASTITVLEQTVIRRFFPPASLKLAMAQQAAAAAAAAAKPKPPLQPTKRD